MENKASGFSQTLADLRAELKVLHEGCEEAVLGEAAFALVVNGFVQW